MFAGPFFLRSMSGRQTNHLFAGSGGEYCPDSAHIVVIAEKSAGKRTCRGDMTLESSNCQLTPH
jgi:hypothetical protein